MLTIVYTTVRKPKVFERKKPGLKGAGRSPQFSTLISLLFQRLQHSLDYFKECFCIFIEVFRYPLEELFCLKLT